MSIKAIPTFYDNTMFRSKLEAKWAFFFNQCKITWNYEPQGYEFDDERYLPDFYFPESKIHVEIKPNMNFETEERTLNKIVNFSKASQEKLIVFVDTPAKAKYYMYSGFSDVSTGKPNLNELHLVWLLNAHDQYQPQYYEKSKMALNEFFIWASNEKF